MPETERRKRTLTDADIEALKESLTCNTCKFSDDQAGTLLSIANNVNTTQKVAGKFIIYGLVATTLGGIGAGIVMAVKHFIVSALAGK